MHSLWSLFRYFAAKLIGDAALTQSIAQSINVTDALFLDAIEHMKQRISEWLRPILQCHHSAVYPTELVSAHTQQMTHCVENDAQSAIRSGSKRCLRMH